MPTEIDVINGKAAVAYLGETPWHRLGTEMTGAPDVATALKAAGLDWQVKLQSMYTRNEKGNLGLKVPNRRAVIRDVDFKVLATVGSDYVPLQNSEAFGVLNAACEQFGVVIDTAGALSHGRVWMLARMPESIEPVPGDKINGYALIVNGHNGWTKYLARLTPIRVVCQNTLSAALKSGSDVIKLRHTKTDLEQMELVAVMMTELVQTLKTTGESFAQLAAKKLTPTAIGEYVNAVLGLAPDAEVSGAAEKKRGRILELATGGRGAELAPGTAWAAFNAVTEFVDHIRSTGVKSEKLLKAADQSALFGPNAKLKAKALKLALAA